MMPAASAKEDSAKRMLRHGNNVEPEVRSGLEAILFLK
jgi:hypothetical protein